MLVPILLAVAIFPAKQPYRFEANFIECCSCKDVCVTEITGRDAGCHGFGAIQFRKGSFGGKSLAGGAAAFAWDSGKWVRLYIDSPDKSRPAVTAFMKKILADWGKLEVVHSGTVRIARAGNRYSLLVDKGHTAGLEMGPVFGGDGRTPVVHGNLSSPMHATLMQGATKSADFADSHPFKLTNTNGFFNMRYAMSGRL